MHQIIGTCPLEIRPLLAQEWKRLGVREIKESYMAVWGEVDERIFYECHLKTRLAGQILTVVSSLRVRDLQELHQGVKKIEWDSFFDVNRTFHVEGVLGDRDIDGWSSNLIAKTVRHAILESFASSNMETDSERAFPRHCLVGKQDAQVIVVAHVQGGQATISLSTTGKSLHKRGHRQYSHYSPIKETLASGLLEIMEYTGEVPFLDPMCGGGTIAIEAAKIALNKACHIHRKKNEFAFEYLNFFENKVWREIQDEARRGQRAEPLAPVMASDIEATHIEGARQNALLARVEKHVSWSTKSFFEMTRPYEKGMLVANLPYGERCSLPHNLEKVDSSFAHRRAPIQSLADQEKAFYQAIGDHLKKNFAGWRIGLLVAEDAPWKFIGLHPTKKVQLKNGKIPVRFLVFDIYEGTKKIKKNDSDLVSL